MSEALADIAAVPFSATNLNNVPAISVTMCLPFRIDAVIAPPKLEALAMLTISPTITL